MPTPVELLRKTLPSPSLPLVSVWGMQDQSHGCDNVRLAEKSHAFGGASLKDDSALVILFCRFGVWFAAVRTESETVDSGSPWRIGCFVTA
jgi:hypothetical protein